MCGRATTPNAENLQLSLSQTESQKDGNLPPTRPIHVRPSYSALHTEMKRSKATRTGSTLTVRKEPKLNGSGSKRMQTSGMPGNRQIPVRLTPNYSARKAVCLELRSMEKTIIRFTCDVQGCEASAEQTPEFEGVDEESGWVTVGPPVPGQYFPEYHICPEHAAPYAAYLQNIEQRSAAWNDFIAPFELRWDTLRRELHADWEQQNPLPAHPGNLKSRS